MRLAPQRDIEQSTVPPFLSREKKGKDEAGQLVKLAAEKTHPEKALANLFEGSRRFGERDWRADFQLS
jgi:hypothetical protein